MFSSVLQPLLFDVALNRWSVRYIGRPDASKFEKIVAKRFRIFRPSLICSLNNCIIIAHFVTRRALKNVTKYSPMMLMMLIAMVWVFIDYVQ